MTATATSGRRVSVERTGRRELAQPRQAELWLPGPDGGVMRGYRARSVAGRGMSARTLVVWCCDWPLVAAGVPPDEPAVIVHANRVIAASPAARDEGVEVGLRRREAQGRCPISPCCPRTSRDARRFEPVVAAVEQLCPRVEITCPGEWPWPPAVRAATGETRPLPGAPAPWSKGAGRHRPRLLFPFGPRRPAYGMGSRRGRHPLRRPPRRKIDFRQPARQRAGSSTCVVGPGETAGFLAVPVRVLERPELTGVLVRLGIRTLGELAALPRSDLVGRFGAEGAVAHRLASGLGGPSAPRPPPSPELSWPPSSTRRPGRPTKRRSWARGWPTSCTSAWTSGGWRARGWRWRSRPNTAAVRAFVAGRGGADGSRRGRSGPLAARRVAERGSANRPTAGIIRIELVPDEVLPAKGRQLGFWGGETATAERASRSLARVVGLLGPEAVRVPEARRPFTGRAGGAGARRRRRSHRAPPALLSAQPDEPWPGNARPYPGVSGTRAPPGGGGRRPGTPHRRQRPGAGRCPTRRVSVAGESWAEVAGWAGPWPLDERWWDAHGHRRRARFQMVTADGAALLLSVEANRWWLEAVPTTDGCGGSPRR